MGRVNGRSAPPLLALQAEELTALHRRLRDHYGPQSWWPAGTEWEMMLGAILVQNTAWTNARRALDRLEAAGLMESPAALLSVPQDVLADHIRPSGYFNQKAAKLRSLAGLVVDVAGGDLEALLAKPLPELRGLLLGVRGVGAETADAICLYAARQPTAVADGYTRRLFGRMGLAPEKVSYRRLYEALMAALPRRTRTHAEFHALVVAHGKRTCLAIPRCDACPILDLCESGRDALGLSPAALGRRTRPQPAAADWNA